MNLELRDIPEVPTSKSKWAAVMSMMLANVGKAVFLPLEGVHIETMRNRMSAVLYRNLPEGFKLHSKGKDGGIYIWLERKNGSK